MSWFYLFELELGTRVAICELVENVGPQESRMFALGVGREERAA